MALSADRDTPRRSGKQYHDPIAASTHIYGGSIVFLDSAGNAEPATLATGKIARGVAMEEVNNTGSAAAKYINVETGVFRFDNHGTITKTSIGDIVYAYDDSAVQASGSSASAVGKMVDIDDDGVWVEIAPAATSTGLVAANNLSDVGTVATARTNLGLGTGDTPTFNGITVTDPITGGSDSNIAINTNKFTVAASSGNTVVAGTLAVTGDVAVNTDKFAVTASSGNTTIAGTCAVTGALSGLAKSQTVTGSAYTVTAADGGIVVIAAADNDVVTLPDAAAGNKGVKVTVVNGGADDAAKVSISPHSSDGIFGTVAAVSASGTVDKDWINTKSGANKGDYTTLVSDGSTGWFIVGGVGVWASQT